MGTVALLEQHSVNKSTFGYFAVSSKRFERNTTIESEVLKPAYFSLMIFDAKGKKVAHPIGKLLQKGVHSIAFDASQLPEGIFTIRLWARHKEYVEQVEKIRYTDINSQNGS